MKGIIRAKRRDPRELDRWGGKPVAERWSGHSYSGQERKQITYPRTHSLPYADIAHCPLYRLLSGMKQALLTVFQLQEQKSDPAMSPAWFPVYARLHQAEKYQGLTLLAGIVLTLSKSAQSQLNSVGEPKNVSGASSDYPRL